MAHRFGTRNIFIISVGFTFLHRLWTVVGDLFLILNRTDFDLIYTSKSMIFDPSLYNFSTKSIQFCAKGCSLTFSHKIHKFWVTFYYVPIDVPKMTKCTPTMYRKQVKTVKAITHLQHSYFPRPNTSTRS